MVWGRGMKEELAKSMRLAPKITTKTLKIIAKIRLFFTFTASCCGIDSLSMNNTESSSIVLPRTIVLVGMMGVGKSSVGRKLASRLATPFYDSDAEIETAAGMTVSEFFETYGEAEFRKGERRVIMRLLEGEPHVLSIGGGAFMDDDTRKLISDRALSIWLKADLPILLERALRRDNRPLLQGADPAKKLEDLLQRRLPTYAKADITVESDDRPVDETVERVLKALADYNHTAKTNS